MGIILYLKQMKALAQLYLMVMATLALLGTVHNAIASSIFPLSPLDHVHASAAVFRGTVLSQASFRGPDDLIYTRTVIRVDEPLFGKFPEVLGVVHRGGQVGTEEEYFGLSPRFARGEYLVFVARGPDGRLQCTQGSASAIPLVRVSPANSHGDEYARPGQELINAVRSLAKLDPHSGGDVRDQGGSGGVTVSAATGMLQGINSRFLQPDRGEPIPYLIDADRLPAGMSLAQATNAVQQALNAWVAVTSLKFKLEGITSFNRGADTITTADGKLRIQLHDNYSRINSAGVLGVGGRGSSTSPAPSGWDLGGNVNGTEFRKSTFGYVILKADNAALENLATFTEVLCHEIGHALNMAHSSETFGETDPALKQAIMYYNAHADGRGATLGSYDPPVIRQAYPANTVPYTYHRVIDATTAPAPVDFAGINEVELRGYDLQTTNLALSTSSPSSINGNFTLTGSKLKYTPRGYFGDSERFDPDTTGNYSYADLVFARFSDGTNASPYSLVRVLSFRGEATLTPDGIPDYWTLKYFGHSTPQAADLSRANDDPDGDGLDNLQEYRAGTNPRAADSNLRVNTFAGQNLQFSAQAYELYELLGSTNLTDWTLVTPIFPTTSFISIRTNLPQTNILTTVSNLPTNLPRMFYRVIKVP